MGYPDVAGFIRRKTSRYIVYSRIIRKHVTIRGESLHRKRYDYAVVSDFEKLPDGILYDGTAAYFDELFRQGMSHTCTLTGRRYDCNTHSYCFSDRQIPNCAAMP